MKKKRFIIVSGRVTRGGTLVLANLCRLLREKGYRARMFYMPSVPTKETNWPKWWMSWIRSTVKMPFVRLLCALNKNSQKDIYKIRREILYQPIKGLPTVIFPFFNKKNTVVVYPEVVYGNFLHATQVVRYLLFYYQFKGDFNAYGKNDLFITFREIFHDYDLSPEMHLIAFNYFDTTLYRQYNFGERKDHCYIGKKGRSRSDYPKSLDGPVIDNGIPEEEIVRILNEHKYCYSYDTQTFYNVIAAVCGCIPVIILEPGKSIEDYIGPNEEHYGVAYGNTPEQIAYAIETRGQLLRSLDYTQRNEENINRFISLIENVFPTCNL